MGRAMRTNPPNVQRASYARSVCMVAHSLRCAENSKDWRGDAQQRDAHKGSFRFPYIQELDFKVLTNGEIVSVVIEQGIVDKALRLYGVHTSHREDLAQEVALILLEMDNDRLNDIYEDGKLSHFITKIVKNQWCSNTSTYYALFRKYEKKKATNELGSIAERCDE